MNTLVLLGDSVFDNAAYVRGGADVTAQLKAMLPTGWAAHLRAVDGSVTSDVARQTRELPAGTSHLIVSVGGNDALGHVGILQERVGSFAEALTRLADISDEFQHDYARMLDGVLSLSLPTAVCTIYYPQLPDASLRRLAVTALTVFNDCILREATLRGLPLLDLRLICDEAEDYANPIEPSVRGGEKIAAAILRLVTEHDFTRRRTELFPR
ncbi:MAG TPA: GDSL-type esterase/lipase family protein [Pyrinomonadaceae bacterium]|nr:GDSL-type esterase/lipase family protein [Pyrinomonadaceae bacterium]